MGNRYADWFRQAEADLRHARNSLEDGDFEPTDFYTEGEARNAVQHAEAILEFCRDQIG
jgi:HEPN domain-containing protein